MVCACHSSAITVMMHWRNMPLGWKRSDEVFKKQWSPRDKKESGANVEMKGDQLPTKICEAFSNVTFTSPNLFFFLLLFAFPSSCPPAFLFYFSFSFHWLLSWPLALFIYYHLPWSDLVPYNLILAY